MHAGSKVVLVEALETILTGADPDLTRPVMSYAKKAFKEVRLKTKVSKMATSGKQINVEFELDGQKKEELFDRVLIAVGRTPNSRKSRPGKHQSHARRKELYSSKRQAATSDPAIYAIR